ncbi:MAG TPA: DUF6320 domain-containing protein [Feifaniaceae bacterium]|nr:DUF6320 domain-containing protein [Feifaniaceae bacterium]
MSYCVNCGVELEKSLQNCPLCGVEAKNPREPFDASAPRPYSARVARIQDQVERRYAAIIISVVLMLAAVVCVMANLVYEDAFTWSIYVVTSLALLWVLAVFPFLHPRLHPVVLVALDVCALLLFLNIINRQDPTSDWYTRLAMPQVLLYGFLALAVVLLWRAPFVRGWQRIGAAVMAGGMGVMGLECLLDLYNSMRVQLEWSWFVIIPAFALGLILFLIERKREVKEEIMKRLRV